MRLWTFVLLGAICVAAVGCSEKGKTQGEQELSEPTGEDSVGFRPDNSVFPTMDSIQSGTYRPLSRPLYMYVNKAALKKAEMAAFLRYVYSEEGSLLIRESGFIPLHENEFKAESDKLEGIIEELKTPTAAFLKGQIMIDGSSTVSPASTAIAEEFSRAHRKIRVPVGTSGTGGGFKKFTMGEIAICNASRHIQPSEIELCEKRGIEYVEFKLCLDGLTVIVNSKADWIAGITVEQLKEIWVTGSKVKRWSDVNPDFPDAPLKLFGPDTDSGTFEYFTETVCGKKGASRSDYQQSGDDNFLVTGIATDEYAMAYMGYSYFVENQRKLKALFVAP